MISNIKQRYFSEFNIDMDKAKKRALVNTENGMITAATEMLGEEIIRKFSLWNTLFPNYQSVKKVTSKKNQREGVDYFITDEEGTLYNIDIKVCCGPNFNFDKDYCYRNPECYHTVKTVEGTINKQAPIELKQNGNRTFVSRKKTDYILFIFADTSGISYAIISYDNVLDIVDECISRYEDIKDERGLPRRSYNEERGPYKHYISNNGSGEYVCYPVAANILQTSI